MTRRSSLRFALAALSLSVVVTAAPPARADYKLTILHLNDLASRILPVTRDGRTCPPEERDSEVCVGGVARLAERLKRERAAIHNPVLVLDAGGTFAGTPIWDTHKQQAISMVTSRLNIDAMGVGASEFAEGSPVLAKFIREVRYPLLASNINVERDPLLRDQIWPFVVIDRGGERIGIVGYSQEDIVRVSKPSAQTRIDPIEGPLRFAIRMIKSMGVNKIIAISHAGYDRDREVAAKFDDINVIVGGRSQTVLGTKIAGAAGPYPAVVKGPSGRPVLIVQAGAYGQYLGRLDITFDNKGGVKSWAGEPIPLDNKIPDDAEMKQVVDWLDATSSIFTATAK